MKILLDEVLNYIADRVTIPSRLILLGYMHNTLNIVTDIPSDTVLGLIQLLKHSLGVNLNIVICDKSVYDTAEYVTQCKDLQVLAPSKLDELCFEVHRGISPIKRWFYRDTINKSDFVCRYNTLFHGEGIGGIV